MWKNSLKNVESDNSKILYETLLDFFLQRNSTYSLNKPRTMPCLSPSQKALCSIICIITNKITINITTVSLYKIHTPTCFDISITPSGSSTSAPC